MLRTRAFYFQWNFTWSRRYQEKCRRIVSSASENAQGKPVPSVQRGLVTSEVRPNWLRRLRLPGCIAVPQPFTMTIGISIAPVIHSYIVTGVRSLDSSIVRPPVDRVCCWLLGTLVPSLQRIMSGQQPLSVIQENSNFTCQGHRLQLLRPATAYLDPLEADLGDTRSTIELE